jgi:hypothetical protein
MLAGAMLFVKEPLLHRAWGGTDAVDPEGNVFALSVAP